MKAYVTVGVSASGKSSLAKKMMEEGKVQGIVERDQIRRNLFNFQQWSEYKFSRQKESQVSDIHCAMIEGFASLGDCNIIVSDTNLNESHRNALIAFLESVGFEVEVIDCDVTWEEACRRDEQREFSVGRKVLYKQWQQWIEYKKLKGDWYYYQPSTSSPNAVVFDIDGTVAHMHNRGPFDWDKVGDDLPKIAVVQLAQFYHKLGFHVIFLSGRDGICYRETRKWITNNIFPNGDYDLFMRAEGDTRKDSIVKLELFRNNIADNYYVMSLFDDRPQVVNMWYDIGIPNVFAVGDQRNEF